MKRYFFIAIALYCYGILTAQDFEKNGMDTTYIPNGLKIGEIAPNFELKSVDGEIFTLYEIIKDKKVVIVFYRGQWCPYCSRHLSSINDSIDFINDKNAVVVAIGPESYENAEKMKGKAGDRFVLLPDANMKVMTDYDVLFTVTESYNKKIKRFLFTSINENNNQKVAKLPVPATYVINNKGEVTYRYFEYNYRIRSSVKDILNALE